MARRHAITEPDLRRSAGILLLAGALLLLVGNVIHPVDDTPTALSRFEFSSAASWLPIHLMIGAGFLAVSAGLGLIAAPAARDGSRAGAALLVAALAGGVSLSLTFVALDGFAVATLADRWEAAAPAGRETVHGAAIALEAIDSGVAGFGTLMLMGVGMLALAIVLHRASHVRLAAASAAVGALGTVTGLALLTSGPTPETINWLLRPSAALMTVTLVALGVSLRRRAATPSPSPTRSQVPVTG